MVKLEVVLKDLDEEYFISVCNTSNTMAEAASKLNLHFNTFKRYAIKFGCYRPNQGGKGTHKDGGNPGYDIKDILSGKYPGYQTYKLKNKLFSAGIKENKCEICGITEWNGQPLNMELHHIDGNRNNFSLNNLQVLCPNCHAQTDNFTSKNQK